MVSAVAMRFHSAAVEWLKTSRFAMDRMAATGSTRSARRATCLRRNRKLSPPLSEARPPRRGQRLLLAQHTDVLQISKIFRIVEPVSDHKFIRNFEPGVLHVYGNHSAAGFVQ